MRKSLLATTTLCIALTLGASPAWAAKKHKHVVRKHHVVSHHKHVAAPSGKEILRIAQRHLSNLGYYHGKIDGVMGTQTRLAIKHFQRDHGLKPDGVAGPKTRAALERADPRGALGGLGGPAPIDPNAPVNQDYTQPISGNIKTVPSRFGTIDVTQNGDGASKTYSVELNGQSILMADGQPSVIGISQTYNLGQEDAIIFTTYGPNHSDSNCVYHTHVLAMDSAGSQLLDVDNCTRGYEAQVNNGSLYITFPEQGEGRAFGATWRVEGKTVERL